MLLNNCSLISIRNADVKLKLQSVHMIITMEDEYSPVPVSNGHFNRIKLEQIIHFSMWLLLCSNNRAAVLMDFLGSWGFFIWAFCQMKFSLRVCFLCGGSLRSSRFLSFSKRSRAGGKLQEWQNKQKGEGVRRQTEMPAMRPRHFTERPQADRTPLGHQLSTSCQIIANDH